MKIKYEDHQKLILKRAYSYHIRYGLDLQELISEGNMAFCEAVQEFDQENGAKFSTFLCWKIRGQFGLMLRERSRMPSTIYNEDFHKDFVSAEHTFFFRDALSKLSKEAQFIVKTVLETPDEIIQMCKDEMTPITKKPYERKRITMQRIKKYLRGLGWTHGLIHQGFREIQTTLKML